MRFWRAAAADGGGGRVASVPVRLVSGEYDTEMAGGVGSVCARRGERRVIVE